MTKRSWVQAPASYNGWMDVSDLLAITLKEKLNVKIAKWGTPNKYSRKNIYLCIALHYYII